ncbi:MAG: lytic transglycosylase domain-containing protein [Chitinophagales bacterium]|nr:lytic transglycosylase domain-containing protein [Bacteroidota bacterium]MCB9043926.1 lytic transglycosylase domain-containing protein [Chitinophagales bacterium]
MKTFGLGLLLGSIITLLSFFLGSGMNIAHINVASANINASENTPSANKNANFNAQESRIDPDQYINWGKLPEAMSFAGERVPLEQYDVSERLERELLVTAFWHSKTIHILKLSGRFLPVVEQILAKNGIPDDFKYLLMAESGFVNATSSAGAEGYWQFMESTAKEYGLEVNTYVDERYNLEKSTEAACQYFQKAYNELGNWTLAAAAYNTGRSNMKSAMERQDEKNYYNLYLNSETWRYVFRVLAFKEIYNYPEKFGYYLQSDEIYTPHNFTTVEVNSIASITDFAKKYGTTYKNIKLLNPWMQNTSVPANKGKVYQVKVPL